MPPGRIDAQRVLERRWRAERLDRDVDAAAGQLLDLRDDVLLLVSSSTTSAPMRLRHLEPRAARCRRR